MPYWRLMTAASSSRRTGLWLFRAESALLMRIYITGFGLVRSEQAKLGTTHRRVQEFRQNAPSMVAH